MNGPSSRHRRGPTRGQVYSALNDFLGSLEGSLQRGAELRASARPAPAQTDPVYGSGGRRYVDPRRRPRVPEVLVIASGSRARLVFARSREPLGPPLPRAQALAIARALVGSRS